MFLWNITYTELNKLAVIFYIILDHFKRNVS